MTFSDACVIDDQIRKYNLCECKRTKDLPYNAIAEGAVNKKKPLIMPDAVD